MGSNEYSIKNKYKNTGSFYSALMKSNSNMVLLSVHYIITAQTRLECFRAHIVYMSIVSNVSITCDCIQFVNRKSQAAFALESIFMAGLHITYKSLYNFKYCFCRKFVEVSLFEELLCIVDILCILTIIYYIIRFTSLCKIFTYLSF